MTEPARIINIDVDDDDDDDIVEIVNPTVSPTDLDLVGPAVKPVSPHQNNASETEDQDVARMPNIEDGKIVVCEDGDEVYYEIDEILDFRMRGSRLEWLVSWKGDPAHTWEPDCNLCSSAKEDAERFRESRLQEIMNQGNTADNAIDLLSSDESDQGSYLESDESESEDDFAINRNNASSSKRPPRKSKGTKSKKSKRSHNRDRAKTKRPRSNGQHIARRSGVVDLAPDSIKDFRNCKYQVQLKDGSLIWVERKSIPKVLHPEADQIKEKLRERNARERLRAQNFGGNALLTFRRNSAFAARGGQRPATSGIAFHLTATSETCEPNNFLKYFVGTRQIHRLDCHYGAQIEVAPKTLAHGGETFKLIAIKNKRKKKHKGSARKFSTENDDVVVLKYVQITTNNENAEEWNPQRELEAIADFQSLPRYKIPARLELLLTPAIQPNFGDECLHKNQFEVLEEEDSHLGCGFIAAQAIQELFPNMRSIIDAIQVRIYAPSIGIAKGMLVAKLGIDKIQLPPSMIKVGPSRTCNEDWAMICVKKLCPSSDNRAFGRYLDGSKEASTTDLTNNCKELSPMYRRLLRGYGIPKIQVDQYVKRARKLTGLKHAHVMGVCDPTGELPEGHIFVTGHFMNDKKERVPFSQHFKKIFISRAPAIEPTDGKYLPLVSKKPANMNDSTWEWLKEKEFGTVFFGKPKERQNAAPLPSLISDGDLDGDLYFLFFDEKLVPMLAETFNCQRIRNAEKELENSVRQKDINNNEGPPSSEVPNDDWLEEATEDMCKINQYAGIGKVTGAIYRLAEKLSESARDGIWDEDVRACARAYKESLDTYKHGNRIILPARLKPDFEKTYRSLVKYITWAE